MGKDMIRIRGAKTHNLKNISIDIPRNAFVVITGLSGSGKSSLAFDTIYAEGQRRYVESLSSYARQFLGQADKPDVDLIEGLSPAIAIKQRSSGGTPRSTVGTVTEIYDFLRLLFARIGTPHCPECGKQIISLTTQEMVDHIMEMPSGAKVQILAPLVKNQEGTHRDLIEKLMKDGYTRVKIDGRIMLLDQEINLSPRQRHSISVVVDRIIIKPDMKRRLTDSIELALSLGKGRIILDTPSGEKVFNQAMICDECDTEIPELTPQHFSFNNPQGACPECKGLGVKRYFDPELIVSEPELSISEGAIPFLKDNENPLYKQLIQIMNLLRIDIYTPYGSLPEPAKRIIMYGTGNETSGVTFSGIIPYLEGLYRKSRNPLKKTEIERYMGMIPCPGCKGARLNNISLAVRFNGLTIYDICRIPIKQAYEFFQQITLSKGHQEIAERIIKEITTRLVFLINVGLDYLSLDRATSTLSGGEEQRVRLATQMSSGLSGVLYVLDEPTVGLHPKDTKRLLKNLMKLKDMGNTVMVVEHDRDMIISSDHVIDMGPGAGPEGGEVVFQGKPAQLIQAENSLTGNYISGKRSISRRRQKRPLGPHWIIIHGASHNNLKNITVKIPLGTLTCITGVSGSGKSTLMEDVLYPEPIKRIYGRNVKSGKVQSADGMEHIDRVINIDQTPIGRSSRSNPATYTGIFYNIRELFSMLPEARARGYGPSRFSFNVKGGRCEACEGEGTQRVEMHFLPDIHVTCDVCNGTRFNRDTLEIRYKGYNIAQILDMSIREALPFFENIPSLKNKLLTLIDVGLGYLKLGQPANTLSGGEAQRLKLSKELGKRSTRRTIYLLDEPTNGLHFEDIRNLLDVLNRLVDQKNTVVVIEHHLDVIKNADFIIDLGPEGGDKGGYVIGMGPPEEIARIEESYTGRFLKQLLP